jgi:V8-like Glu-specific endopeptidase
MQMTSSLLAALATSLLAVAAVGCSAGDTGEEPVQTTDQAKVIGTNDLIPVTNDGANVPEKYRGLPNAFGIISMGCTATHIGNGVVLTAGHCFSAGPTRKNNFACTGTTVRWGVRTDSPAYLTSKCTTVYAAQQSHDIDYSIFQVDVAPPVSVDVDLSARPAYDSNITIFSHPHLRPLEWSQVCQVKPSTNGGWGANQFSHQCDTDPGSSGATVLDDDTLKVVGIHDGGIAPWNYGTFLYDTPLAEVLASLATPAAPAPAAVSDDATE